MFENKIVAVMNKSVDPGKSMNALAHICLGFSLSGVEKEAFHFMNYKTRDGYEYPSISKIPFIILKASANKVKDLVKKARCEKIKFGAFTETMTIGSWQEQEKSTRERGEEEHHFLGIVMLGQKELVTKMTKKFSIWRV